MFSKPPSPMPSDITSQVSDDKLSKTGMESHVTTDILYEH